MGRSIIIFGIVFFAFIRPSMAQSNANAIDAATITGVISFEMLDTNNNCSWFPEGYSKYQPDTTILKKLAKTLPDYELVIFIGTWCSDSKDLIPKLYKVLREINYPMDQVVMYGLDMSKTSPDGLHEKHLIEWLPTIIVKQFGSEVGRITEEVEKSVEADLLNICMQ